MNNNPPKIDQKVEKIRKTVSFLQDLTLKIKLQLDSLTQAQKKEDFFTELTTKADEEIEAFLLERSKECSISERCTVMIEKGALKVLKTYTEKGPKQAINHINSYVKYTKKATSEGLCLDDECLRRATRVFESLKTLFQHAHEKKLRSIEDLHSSVRDITSLEDIEKECDLIAPLSNEKRISILKILANGSLYYNQLEDKLGIKGGHFHFHLEKLVRVGYITQDEDKGPYSLTKSGLKALQFLYNLKEEVYYD